MDAEEVNALSRVVVNCGFEVHQTLGPGLLESVYEAALAYELQLQKLKFIRQMPLPVVYKGVDLSSMMISFSIKKSSRKSICKSTPL